MYKHCLAPWTHTYLSPQSERRMCCASREPAQNFKQYIDTDAGTNGYAPMTLEEHWNSEHMKSVRRRMMAGETLPECQVCDKKLLNTSVYRDYWEGMFGNMREKLLAETDADGTHHGLPVSYDYRLKNTCTFKCRMCGPMLSSAWEAEERQHNSQFEQNNPWAEINTRKAIRSFQGKTGLEELWAAIKERRIAEIYWVGGEPLDWPEHWEMMQYMVENDTAKDVYVRYNTNLSRIEYKNMQLYELLGEFKDWQMCASLDGTGRVGEYIRTGLNYNQWHHNFNVGRIASTHSRQMKIDLTLTLPGLVDLHNMIQLVHDFNAELLTKITFAFSPDIVMSPMCLPRKLLDHTIDTLLSKLDPDPRASSLFDTLKNMKSLPNFQEQWPEEYLLGLWRGKSRILELEERRNDLYTMDKILGDSLIGEWWRGI